MIHLNLLVLFELNAVQALSEPEHTFLHCLQFEIRAQVIVRDIVFLFLEFFAVIAEVPRLKMLRIEPVRMRIVLYFLHFRQSGRHIRVAQLI